MSYYSYNNRGGGFLSSIPTATKNIIVINVLVMIMTSLNGDLMYQKFALFYPTSPFFRWWQPVTHMFMHGGFWHLFFNMYTLYFFGRVLEERWGAKKFLIFYFVTGLGAALIHTGVEWIQGLESLSEGFAVVGEIAIVLAGAFPLVYAVTKVLEKPLLKLGRLLGINDTAAAGLIATLAKSIATFGLVKDMDHRGKVVNIAFAVSAAFVFGDHLGFTAGFAPELLPAMILGKLTGGIAAVAVALLLTRKYRD